MKLYSDEVRKQFVKSAERSGADTCPRPRKPATSSVRRWPTTSSTSWCSRARTAKSATAARRDQGRRGKAW